MDLVAASWVATAAPGATVWVDRYPEAARAYEAAFRKHGIDPLGGDVDAVVATFRKQPAEVREVILAALERWELSLTAAKQPGADQLRSVQDAFDLAPWRKQLRLAREDANEAILLQVAAEAAKQPLTGDQAEVVALAVQVSSAAGKPEAIPILRSLRQKQPAAYGVNAALAATLFASKGSSRQEVAAALEASSLARPESPVPHLRLATVYTELKDLVRAKAETERGQEKQYPEASRFLKEAWTLCEMRKFPEAVAVAEKATEAAAGWPLAHATLGIARRRIGKTEAAEAAFRKAVELAPSEAAAIELLRNIFTRDAGPQPPLNRLKEQLYSDRLEAEVLRRVVKFRSDPSLTTLAKLWRCLLGVDQIDERLAICERMFPLAKTEKWKNDLTSAYVSRAAASGRLLRLDTPIVQQLQKLNPLAFDHLGLIAVRNGQPDVAVDTCLAAYAKSKDDWFQKPRALALARHWASGDGSGKSFEKKLRKLQEDDPLDLRPAVMLALNDALADREKEAALALRRTRARFNAPNLPASTALAADFLIMGRLDDAVRVAQLYEFAGTFDSNRKPYDRWGLYFRAFAFLRAGDVRGAESHAQAAYQNSFEHLLAVPRGPLGFWEIAVHTYAASALGRVRFRQGRYREAAEILSDAHGIDPFLVNFDYYPHAQLDLGADYAAALLAAGDLAEASKVARQIVGFRPEKATARQALGQVLLAEGKPTEAAAEFRAAAKLDPFDGHADFHLGRALLNSGDLDGAVKAFEQSIRSYHRRWIRDFASIPEDAAVAVLSALRKKLFESLPADQRKTYQAKAIGWVKNDMAAWRKKAESDVPFEYASAASVLKRLVEVKFDQDRSLVDALPDDLKSEWRDVWKEAETIRHIAAAKREKLPQDPMEWHWPASREREVAEWVLKQGGMVTVVCPTAQGRIHRMDLLPQVPFRIEGVSLSGLSVDDSAIDKLAGLLMLTEVHLDGTKVTDAGIRKLVEVAPLLSRLNIERTKVGDGGLAAVAHLTEVYARRSSVTPGSVAAANNDRFGPKVLHESALAKSNGKKLAGHALRFDGMTAYVELPISYTSGQPITMEATILIEPGMCNRYGRVVECELEHKSGITTFLHMGRESHSAVNVKGAYHWTPRPKSTIPFLERTQIALSFDGTTLRAFVNGKLIGDTKKPEVQRGIQMDRMFLGKQGTHASEHFRGVIDEVRISSTCRYLKDYTPSPKLEADAFTEGLYHMDEGSGESLRDSSGKGRNGRIVNAKWVREEEE
ncbi:MAG: tetratricopeptide repeat protein [Gemmataceae bacterium]